MSGKRKPYDALIHFYRTARISNLKHPLEKSTVLTKSPEDLRTISYNDIEKHDQHLQEFRFKKYLHPSINPLNSKNKVKKYRDQLQNERYHDQERITNPKFVPLAITNNEFLAMKHYRNKDASNKGDAMNSKSFDMNLAYKILIQDVFSVGTSSQVMLHHFRNEDVTNAVESSPRLLDEDGIPYMEKVDDIRKKIKSKKTENTGFIGKPLSVDFEDGPDSDFSDIFSKPNGTLQDPEAKFPQRSPIDFLRVQLSNKIRYDTAHKQTSDELLTLLKERIEANNLEKKSVSEESAKQAVTESTIKNKNYSAVDACFVQETDQKDSVPEMVGLENDTYKIYSLETRDTEIFYNLPSKKEFVSEPAYNYLIEKCFGFEFDIDSNISSKAYITSLYHIFNVKAIGFTKDNKDYDTLVSMSHIIHPIDPTRKLPLVNMSRVTNVEFVKLYHSTFNGSMHVFCLVPDVFEQDLKICEHSELEPRSGKDFDLPLVDMNGEINRDLVPESYRDLNTRDEIMKKIIKDLKLESISECAGFLGNPIDNTIIRATKTYLKHEATDEEICLTEYSNGIELLSNKVVNILSTVDGFKSIINQKIFSYGGFLEHARPSIIGNKQEELILDSLNVDTSDTRCNENKKQQLEIEKNYESLGKRLDAKHVFPKLPRKKFTLVPQIMYESGGELKPLPSFDVKEIFCQPNFNDTSKEYLSLDSIDSLFTNGSTNGKKGLKNLDAIRGMLLNVNSNNQVIISDAMFEKEKRSVGAIVNFFEWYRKYYESDPNRKIKMDIMSHVCRTSQYVRPWDLYIAQKIMILVNNFESSYGRRSLQEMNKGLDDFLYDYIYGYLEMIKNELYFNKNFDNKDLRERRKMIFHLLGNALYHFSNTLFKFKYPRLSKYYFDTSNFTAADKFTTSSQRKEEYDLGHFYIFFGKAMSDIRLDIVSILGKNFIDPKENLVENDFKSNFYHKVANLPKSITEKMKHVTSIQALKGSIASAGNVPNLKMKYTVNNAISLSKGASSESVRSATLYNTYQKEMFAATDKNPILSKNEFVLYVALNPNKSTKRSSALANDVAKSFNKIKQFLFSPVVPVFYMHIDSFHVPKNYQVVRYYDFEYTMENGDSDMFNVKAYLLQYKDLHRYRVLKELVHSPAASDEIEKHKDSLEIMKKYNKIAFNRKWNGKTNESGNKKNYQ
ncbi:hypothetical protein DASC09_034010 [Saccharomycopsis crataegensis]|uniref:Uncharacterized protein n=1 Tax=Saccharomycopsis crataegensis TaxID=43959 RepID=A0AAV5QNB4_9ASCO|nr:hypothetical protein DASC09_034010 [Saccharomycopsis crataegensis]